MRRFFVAFLLVALAGLIQNTGLFMVFGIKPDLLLAALVAASFFLESSAAYLLLLAISVLFLRFESGFRPELLVFGFLAVSAFLVSHRLPWRRSVSSLVLTAISVVIFYAVVDTAYLFSSFLPVMAETIYTVIFGILFYDLFRQFGDNEENIFKR